MLAFVIMGHFLGSDESATGASLDVDAGIVHDAGPAIDEGDARAPYADPDAGAKKNRRKNRKNRKNRRGNKNRKKKKGKKDR